MAKMIQFDRKHLKGLEEAIEFLDMYTDSLDPISVLEDGSPSDYTLLTKALSDLRAISKGKEARTEEEIRKEFEKKAEEDSKDTVTMTRKQLEDLIYNERKNARENVNPNFRYAVTDFDVEECRLTDDIGVAIETAARMSNSGKGYNISRIVKERDGTWKLHIEGYCIGGHYEDRERGLSDYLHFDYVASRCEVRKI